MVPAGAAFAALIIAACGAGARRATPSGRVRAAVGGPRSSGVRPAPAARRIRTAVGAAQTTGRGVGTQTGTTVGGPATAPPPSAAQIAAAAALTAAAPGFSAHVSASILLPQFSGNALTATGSGHYDPRSGSGTLRLAVGLPGLLGLAGPLPTRVVLSGGDAYVRVPAAIAGQLHGSAAWLRTTVAALGLGTTLSPAEILREVARDATTSVPGQRARVTIDAASGRVSTVALVYTEPGGYRVRVRLRFAGFAPQPASPPPPATQTGSLSAALAQLGF